MGFSSHEHGALSGKRRGDGTRLGGTQVLFRIASWHGRGVWNTVHLALTVRL